MRRINQVPANIGCIFMFVYSIKSKALARVPPGIIILFSIDWRGVCIRAHRLLQTCSKGQPPTLQESTVRGAKSRQKSFSFSLIFY